MINKTLALLAILLFSAIQPAFCAFPVRHNQVSTVLVTPAASRQNASHKTRLIPGFASRIANVVDACSVLLHPEKIRTNTFGTLSLIFGITGIIFSPLSVPAIIFAIIGLKHDERYSLAGLILGIIGALELALIILLWVG
jgi:hypothetical protein